MRKTADAVSAGKTGLINGVVKGVSQERDHCTTVSHLVHRVLLALLFSSYFMHCKHWTDPHFSLLGVCLSSKHLHFFLAPFQSDAPTAGHTCHWRCLQDFPCPSCTYPSSLYMSWSELPHNIHVLVLQCPIGPVHYIATSNFHNLNTTPFVLVFSSVRIEVLLGNVVACAFRGIGDKT